MEFKKIFKIGVLFLILSTIFLFAYVGNPTQVALAPGDSYNLNFPLLSYNSGFKLWNPYVQTGKNSVLDLQGQALYPPILIISAFRNKVVGFNLYILIQISLAGLFMYLFLKSLKRSDIAAILGGMVLIFGGFYSGHRGHGSMISVMMWLPLILFFINKFFEKNNKRYLFYAAGGLAFSILAGDPAFVLYSSLIIIPYIVFSVLDNKKPFLKTFLQIIVIVYMFGILTSSMLVIPAFNSFGIISRSKNSWENFSAEAFNPVQILGFVFPAAMQGIDYWGRWGTSFSAAAPVFESLSYFGILPFILYLSSFFYKFRNKYINFWKILSVLFLILMAGTFTPLYRFIYNYVSIFNLFSISARYNGVFLFCTAIVFCYIFDEYVIRILDFKSFFKYFSFPIFSFFILFLSASSFFGNFFKKAFTKVLKILFLRNQDIELFRNFKINNSALLIPVIVFSVFIIFSYIYFLHNKNKKIFAFLLILLVFLDLFSLNSFNEKNGDLNINLENKNFEIFKNIDKEINSGKFRILSLENTQWPIVGVQPLVPNVNILYKIPSFSGYGPVVCKDFLIESNLDTSGNYFYGYEDMLSNPTILGKEDSIKYIYTSNVDISNFISNFKFKDFSYKKKNIVYSFDGKNNNLTFSNSKMNEKEIELSGDSTRGIYSIAQTEVKLEKNCDYLISVEAYSKNPKGVNAWLFSDIVDNKEYSTKKTIYIYPFEILTKPTVFTRIINTGDLGKNTYFRVATSSKSPIFIKSFSLTKVLKVFSNEKEIFPYEKVFQENNFCIYKNIFAEDRAKIYIEANIYEGIEDYKALLYERQKNYDTLYFQKPFLLQGSKAISSGTILNSSYGEDKIVFKVQNTDQIFFELKDYYDKEWKCYIDGKETKIYKVNGIFKGIIIEESGTHTVVFKYVPMTFYVGLAITILSFGFILFFGVKSGKNKELFKVNKN